MNKTLIIDALRAVDEVPNSLDRNILIQIQEDLACDVMKLYRDDFARLLRKQNDAGVRAEEAVEERKAFFAERLNVEYRNRTGTSGAFSLPMYLETAENHYRMEIRRNLQQVQDYIAHGRNVAEQHFTNSAREMRTVDPGMRDMANKVATGLNSINDALEKLSRIGKDMAMRVVKDLQEDLGAGLKNIQSDNFSRSVLDEAQMLADAQRELARLDNNEKQTAPRH